MAGLGTIIRGTTFPITFVLKDEDGTPIDLTGYTVFFTAKINTTDADNSAVISKTVTDPHSNPTAGETTIELSSTDTDIAAGRYYYDIKLKDPDGDIQAIPYARFKIKENITDRTS